MHVTCDRRSILLCQCCNMLCTFSFFPIVVPIWQHDDAAAASMQCYSRANTPAAWHWLRPVSNDDKRQDKTIPSSNGCRGVVGMMHRKYVCLSVCLFARSHNSKTARPNFTKLSTHVAYGRGAQSSVGGAVCQLCTSGFVDDVMFSHSSPATVHYEHH